MNIRPSSLQRALALLSRHRAHAAALSTAALAAFFIAGCASSTTTTSSRKALGSTYSGGYHADSAPRAEARPGLGTGWGEERDSRTRQTDFVRANGNRPAAVDRVYYNDREGIEAMLAAEGGSDRRAKGLVRMADGLISTGLKDGSGNWLDGWMAGGSRFVAGDRGERYEVVVRNETRDRVEVVLSVDGLDVMDGRSASFSKRGYIVHPGDTLTVDGFRTSSSTVAAFRFSRVDRSYAALKHGNTRNVGVIGMAVFRERDSDVWRRQGANPFPGSRWATPPQ